MLYIMSAIQISKGNLQPVSSPNLFMLGSDISVTDYPGKIPKGVAVVEDNNIKG
ncbi:hypothetical protein YC2023_073004 [Brassica napus]